MTLSFFIAGRIFLMLRKEAKRLNAMDFFKLHFMVTRAAEENNPYVYECLIHLQDTRLKKPETMDLTFMHKAYLSERDKIKNSKA